MFDYTLYSSSTEFNRLYKNICQCLITFTIFQWTISWIWISSRWISVFWFVPSNFSVNSTRCLKSLANIYSHLQYFNAQLVAFSYHRGWISFCWVVLTNFFENTTSRQNFDQNLFTFATLECTVSGILISSRVNFFLWGRINEFFCELYKLSKL